MSATPTPGTTSAAAPGPAPGRARHVLAVLVLIPAVVALALWAFAWPAARTAPRDLPIAVAGAPAAVAGLEHQLERKEGAFEVHRYDDEAAARAAIEDRDVYGAIVATERGPRLLTASAASPVVAQMLKETASAQAPKGAPVQVEDVVAAPPGDPRGAALGASVLPMALAGVAAGAVVTLLGLRGVRAACALVGAAALVGVVAAALTHSWLGALTGDWWTEAGVLALSTLAVSATVAGLAAVLGRAGIALGALTVVLIGNPFSGVASAPELLPEPAGAIGQWLPPGAGGTLLRSVSFFDGAAASRPAWTLAVWAGVGLVLVLVGGAVRGRRAG
ncbi:ABC transporter permease [Streptomyces sp. LHD-70]|uniref:ABC transporter permease n=1 Tax=Streptomyces sp. LHD-70 TaxID=3072140 RepID=UPI00280DB790|nr:ABC transporter permease [Streptomyces sp. LHD-70]MDQ8706426.1 ABC transporter permease [Streptomyces sp. LHD-70]